MPELSVRLPSSALATSAGGAYRRGARSLRELAGEAELAADGSFALRGLVPGVYRFELRYRWMDLRPNGGGSGSANRLPLEIPEVTATAGETSELAIDATRFAPAHLRGRLLLDGEPPSNAVLALSSSSARHGAFTPAADGSYVARELLPGKLIAQLVLESGSSGTEVAIFGEEELELAPGEERVADLRFVRRRLELELLDRDGATALAHAELSWSHGRRRGSAKADDRGVAVIDPAPVGPIRISCSIGEGASRRSEELGTVELPAGAKVHRAQLRRP
ncbi:MAG: hypothetical protein JNM84_15270 [Planctomycetes bacterium]|nr:hypothetical protein [Planctomycetota bacterium]